MKNLIKTIFVLILIFLSEPMCYGVGASDVTLIVTSEGHTKEEAVKNALRSAIEQTYGAFVSSDTELLNDEIVKDEIATISSGNIKKYKELSSITSSSGNTSVTLEAIVSVSKLISYAQSKGATCEVDGQSLAAGIELQQLYKRNEEIAIANILKQVESALKDGFDYKASVGEIGFDNTENSWFYGTDYNSVKTEYNGNDVIIPFKITASLNKVGKNSFYYLYDMIDQLAEKEPTREELENMQKMAVKELAQYIKDEEKNIKKAFKEWKNQYSDSGMFDGINKYQLYNDYIQNVWLKENPGIMKMIFAKQGLNEDGYPFCYQNMNNSWDYFLPTVELINRDIQSSRDNMAKARGREADPHRLFFRSRKSIEMLQEFFCEGVNKILSDYALIMDNGLNTKIDRNNLEERFAISAYSQTNNHLPIIKEGSEFYFSTGTVRITIDEVKKMRKLEVVKN